MDIKDERTNDLSSEMVALKKAFPPGTAGRDAYKARRRIAAIKTELQRRQSESKRKGGH
jgi:hypothetical protein